jgi:hypothetical protein
MTSCGWKGSERLRGRIPIAIAFIFLLVLPTSIATADRDEDTTSIAPDESVVVTLDLKNVTGITYEVEVNEGPNVNVLFLSQSDYSAYSSDLPFKYYDIGTNVDVSYAKEEFNWTKEGLFYIVINTERNAEPGEVASVTYNVEWEDLGPPTRKSSFTYYVLIGLFFGFLILLFILDHFGNIFRRRSD